VTLTVRQIARLFTLAGITDPGYNAAACYLDSCSRAHLLP